MRRTENIHVRIKPEEKDVIRKAAEKLNMSISEYIIIAVKEKLQSAGE